LLHFAGIGQPALGKSLTCGTEASRFDSRSRMQALRSSSLSTASSARRPCRRNSSWPRSSRSGLAVGLVWPPQTSRTLHARRTGRSQQRSHRW